jgi:hypothetical protein
MSDAAAHAIWTLARARRGFFDDGSFKTKRQQRTVAPRRSVGEARR